MKKFLLTLVGLTLGLTGFVASAQDEVIQSFSTGENFPSGTNTNVPESATITTKTTQITYSLVKTYVNGSNLVLSKNATANSPASISWTLDYACSQLILKAGSGTPAAAAKVNVFINGELVKENLTPTTANAVYTIDIDKNLQVANATYKIESTTNANATFSQFTFVKVSESGDGGGSTDPDPSDPEPDGSQDVITENWANWNQFSISSADPITKVSNDTNTSSPTYISYTMSGCQTNYSPNYLMINGSKYSGAYIEFTLPFECSKIVAKTTGSGSQKDTNQIMFLINDVQQEITTVNELNKEYTFNVPAGEGTQGVTYKFQSVNAINTQFVSFTYYKATDDPEISINSSYNFVAPLNGNQSITVVPAIKNYTEDITISIDNEQFTAPLSMSVDEIQNGFTLTYNGTTPGSTTATLTLTAGEAEATATLTGYTAEHAGTEENPLSVLDVLNMNNLNEGPFYVEGIVNDKTAQNGSNGVVGQKDQADNTNIILKDQEGNMIPVQLPSGDARNNLNIVSNPSLVGKTIIVQGKLQSYFGVPGIKETQYVPLPPTDVDTPEITFNKNTNTVTIVCDTENSVIYYTTDGTEPDNTSTKYENPFTISSSVTVKAIAYVGEDVSNVNTVVCNYFGTYSNFAEYVAANPTAGGLVEGPITAVYQNGKYLYTKDNAGGYMLIFGDLDDTFENGDQIESLEGNYSPYNGLPEIQDATFGNITTGGTPVEPEEISLGEVTADMVNTYVTVSGVTIENEGSNYTIVDGEDSLVLYNRFSVTFPTTPIADDSTFTIVGFISIFGSTLQLYPISFDETTGVNAIGSEVAGEEVYYNLQGMKVQNPVKGQIYIVNGKKVLVK